MSLLDSAFGVRDIFVNGVERIFRNRWDFRGPNWTISDSVDDQGRPITAIETAGGSGGEPLTLCFWVDVGRTTSTEDGSIGQPFKTVQAAIDALIPLLGGRRGTVLVVPGGDYTAQSFLIDHQLIDVIGVGAFTSQENQGPGSHLPTFAAIDIENFAEGSPDHVVLVGLACDTLTVNGGVSLRDFVATTWTLSGAEISADPDTVFGYTPGTVTLVGQVSLVVAGKTFAVGALAAAFTDVTVTGINGANPGDDVLVTMTTQLAGVGCVGAWVSAANEVTARFFGTTAGGDVVANVRFWP